LNKVGNGFKKLRGKFLC